MLIKEKEVLQRYIEEVYKEFLQAEQAVPDLLSDAKTKLDKTFKAVIEQIVEGEIVVPFIGGFSAGKSSAINYLLIQSTLPVAVTAETAIPAECRFSPDEHIVAYNSNKQTSRHPISELKQLSKDASNYQVVHLFLNNPLLQSIEPIIIADMPGFESTVAQHNDAILKYLYHGSYYFYFISCENGTLKTSDIQTLQQIKESGADFSVVITKTDLLHGDSLNEVCELIREQITDNFDAQVRIITISKKNIQPLVDELKKMNPDYLFRSKYISQARDMYYETSSAINRTITALEKDKNQGAEEISSLTEALAELEEDKNKNLEQFLKGGKNTGESILSNLKRTLNNAIPDLVIAAKAGNNALEQSISGIVRTTLVRELESEIRDYSESAQHTIQESLRLSIKADLIQVDKNWISHVLSNIQTEVMSLLVGSLNNTNSKGKTGVGAGVGVLSTLALAIPHPVVRIVMAILPSVISMLFNKAQEKNEDEQYKNIITTQVIPSVLEQVRPTIMETLQNVKTSIYNTLVSKFEEKIKEMKSTLEQAQQSLNDQNSSIQEKIECLKKANQCINELTESHNILN